MKKKVKAKLALPIHFELEMPDVSVLPRITKLITQDDNLVLVPIPKDSLPSLTFWAKVSGELSHQPVSPTKIIQGEGTTDTLYFTNNQETSGILILSFN